jgi:hypothetical protein
MKTPRISGSAFWPLAAITILVACDGNGGFEPQRVDSVMISPNPSQIEVGATVQLAATVLTASGSVLSGHPVTWASSRSDIASVSASGLVSALAPGSTSITATSEGRSGSIQITVVPGACRASFAAASISVGESRGGALDATDCELFGSSRAVGYELDLSSDAMIEITMSASQFVPFILLTDRQMIDWGWGYYDGSSARLRANLPPGRMTRASSASAAASARYPNVVCNQRMSALPVLKRNVVTKTRAPSDCLNVARPSNSTHTRAPSCVSKVPRSVGLLTLSGRLDARLVRCSDPARRSPVSDPSIVPYSCPPLS